MMAGAAGPPGALTCGAVAGTVVVLPGSAALRGRPTWRSRDLARSFMLLWSADGQPVRIGRGARFRGHPRGVVRRLIGAGTPPQVGVGSSAVRRMAWAAGWPLRSTGEEACCLGCRAPAAHAGPRARGGPGRLQRGLADPGGRAATPARRCVRAGRAAGIAADLAAAVAGRCLPDHR